MTSLTKLNKEVEAIKLRNSKVESDKKWETSWQRRSLVALLTYIVMVIFMASINISHPLINAITPTLGFILSTLTLEKAKKHWLMTSSINKINSK